MPAYCPQIDRARPAPPPPPRGPLVRFVDACCCAVIVGGVIWIAVALWLVLEGGL